MVGSTQLLRSDSRSNRLLRGIHNQALISSNEGPFALNSDGAVLIWSRSKSDPLSHLFVGIQFVHSMVDFGYTVGIDPHLITGRKNLYFPLKVRRPISFAGKYDEQS